MRSVSGAADYWTQSWRSILPYVSSFLRRAPYSGADRNTHIMAEHAHQDRRRCSSQTAGRADDGGRREGMPMQDKTRRHNVHSNNWSQTEISSAERCSLHRVGNPQRNLESISSNEIIIVKILIYKIFVITYIYLLFSHLYEMKIITSNIYSRG